MTSSLKLAARAAFEQFEKHPLDSSIVVSRDPAAIIAIADESCKAVIWQRELPEPLARVIDGLSPDQTRLLHERFSQKKAGRFDPADAVTALQSRDVFHSSDDARILGEDVASLGRHAMGAVTSCKYPYAWFHGHLFLTPKYHVDTIAAVKLSTVYKGRGLRFLAGNLSDQDYDDAVAKRVHLDPEEAEARYTMEDMRPGDVLAMKSKNDGSRFGTTQSLVHRSVDDEAAGMDRLFLGVDAYHPVF